MLKQAAEAPNIYSIGTVLFVHFTFYKLHE
jgi:hypothetical protein